MPLIARAAFVVLCAIALQLGCAGPLPVGERSSAIIGGTLDTGDPQVVLLISYPTDESTYFTCTASVLAPTLLVTAAHCVDEPNHPGYVFGVFLGDDASSYASAAELAAVLLPVAAVHAYPQYDPTTPFTGDVGVVVMASPVGRVAADRAHAAAQQPRRPSRAHHRLRTNDLRHLQRGQVRGHHDRRFLGHGHR